MTIPAKITTAVTVAAALTLVAAATLAFGLWRLADGLVKGNREVCGDE